ncbi:hypothetical protein SAY86_001424 [Trapa natans]|uniref:J domain-containing protein n=1 Tax=Trapa natans TaxID=22666 RepID=A0AAN7RMD9_TRANT|nr:hypothetical protein SAY86_001424 [Trapa natans]
MDVDVDHYLVLGLPTGDEGTKLSEKEISKAYRAKALELHPDKRQDDPDAHANFQRLKSSYEILKNDKERKAFDDRLRTRLEQQRRQTQQDSRKRKLVSNLEERERAAFAPDPSAVARKEDEKINQKFRDEIAAIRAMHANKGEATPPLKTTNVSSGKGSTGGSDNGLDKDKVLKVTWEKVGPDYSPERLKELFSSFGKVEDVVIRSTKKRGSALVVMGSRDAVVAATGTTCGDLSNPLLVVPLQPTVATEFSSFQKPVEKDPMDKIVGKGYQDYEDLVMKKLQRAAQKRK